MKNYLILFLAVLTLSLTVHGGQGLDIQIKARKSTSLLTIEYDVFNPTRKNAYLFDRLPAKADGAYTPHNEAFCFFENGTLNLLRGVLPLPKSLAVGKYQLPLARLLAPNQSLHGKIEIPLPAVEYSPFFAPLKPEEALTQNFSKLRLALGWTALKKGMIPKKVSPGGETLYSIKGVWENPYQNSLEIELFVSGAINIYPTGFERPQLLTYSQ